MSTDTDDTDHDGPSIEMLAREARGELDHSLNLGWLPHRKRGALFTSNPDPVRLLALVAAVTAEPHIPSGSALIEGLEATLGQSYSTGTVYPVLHDYHDEGLLSRVDLGRTKAYTAGDPDAIDEALAGFEAELVWYLEAVREARDELDTDGESDTETETGTE